jgi:hypothetical protein
MAMNCSCGSGWRMIDTGRNQPGYFIVSGGSGTCGASPPGTPLLNRLGFDGYGFDKPALFDGAPARAVTVPYWFLILLTLVTPTLWVSGAVRRLRRNRRAAVGLCPL